MLNKNGMKSIAFTGNNIKHVEKITNEIISIPAINTSRIQEAHILMVKCYAMLLKQRLDYHFCKRTNLIK